MNLMLHLLLCGVLLVATIALYLYRHWLENQEDRYIHLHNDAHDSTIITAQTSMCKRCEIVDKFKYATLIATIVYAVAIAGMVTYQAWNKPGI